MNNQKLIRQLAMIEQDYDFYHHTLVQCSTDSVNALLLQKAKENSKVILDMMQDNINLLVQITQPHIVKQ